ncbi:MAG: DUF4249 domain-containing protein [Cyclobacteriaceae bacterium]
MKNRSNYIIHILLAIVITSGLSGCVQEVEPFGKSSETPLIVTGRITNQPGPHTVKLVFEEGFNILPDYNLVEGSVVKIMDDLGNEEILTYNSFGRFNTSESFSAVIGRSYHLEITLPSDVAYESIPETMVDVPSISKVDYKKGDGTIIFTVDYQDEPGVENYYRWGYRGIYEVFSSMAESSGGSGTLGRASRCYPANINKNRFPTCWVTDFDAELLRIESDELFDGKERTGEEVYQVDLTRKFDIGYLGTIKQYSLTKSAYEYWNAIDNQLGNTGSIFESSNYQIKGNIREKEDPTKLVLGYFEVSAVTESSVFVEEYSNTFDPIDCTANEAGCIPARCISCLSYGPTATRVKPENWPK